MTVRVIDAGHLPPVESQAIYHGIAHAWSDASPDTVLLVTPRDPYVCIGFHQDLTAEIDVELCRQRGLPVVRRELGGGAVYLDSDQLFVQWVMAGSSLPARLDHRFARFAEPLVATYRALGIEARFHPVNDLQVADRKICGTGAARIGGAEVLVGNFLFDFDVEAMARVLRVPSEEFRGELRDSLQRYMTTARRELGAAPDEAEVRARYLEQCRATLGAELVPGTLTGEEEAAVARVSARFRSDEFLQQPGGLRRPGVKIHEDVWVSESSVAVPGGRIRAVARVREHRLERVSLHAEPDSEGGAPLEALAAALQGLEIRAEQLRPIVLEYYRRPASGSARADDWVEALLRLEHKERGA